MRLLSNDSALFFLKGVISLENVKFMRANDRQQNQLIREENLEARKHYDADGMKRLMSVMCLGAVHDWLRADMELNRIELRQSRFRGVNMDVQKGNYLRMKRDCEEFFDTDIFTHMTGLDGKEEAIRRLKKVPAGTSMRSIERGLKLV